MPRFTLKTTIEIEIEVAAKDSDAALTKAEQIEIDLSINPPKKLKIASSDIWNSLEDSLDWTVEEA